MIVTRADMKYLRWHWEQDYEITEDNGRFTARARFGSRDVLEADSPVELLTLVRRHYPRHRGTEQCST